MSSSVINQTDLTVMYVLPGNERVRKMYLNEIVLFNDVIIMHYCLSLFDLFLDLFIEHQGFASFCPYKTSLTILNPL